MSTTPTVPSAVAVASIPAQTPPAVPTPAAAPRRSNLASRFIVRAAPAPAVSAAALPTLPASAVPTAISSISSVAPTPLAAPVVAQPAPLAAPVVSTPAPALSQAPTQIAPPVRSRLANRFRPQQTPSVPAASPQAQVSSLPLASATLPAVAVVPSAVSLTAAQITTPTLPLVPAALPAVSVAPAAGPLASVPAAPVVVAPTRSEYTFQAGPATIRLMHGNLLTQPVRVIVNAANQEGIGGGGIDGAINSAAGQELITFRRSLPQVTPGVRCPTGQAIVTPGFGLTSGANRTHIVHTAGPVYQEARLQEQSGQLHSCYMSSLARTEEIAVQNGLENISVGFSGISIGIFHFPEDVAMRQAIGAIQQYFREHPQSRIREVRLVYVTEADRVGPVNTYTPAYNTARQLVALTEAGTPLAPALPSASATLARVATRPARPVMSPEEQAGMDAFMQILSEPSLRALAPSVSTPAQVVTPSPAAGSQTQAAPTPVVSPAPSGPAEVRPTRSLASRFARSSAAASQTTPPASIIQPTSATPVQARPAELNPTEQRIRAIRTEITVTFQGARSMLTHRLNELNRELTDIINTPGREAIENPAILRTMVREELNRRDEERVRDLIEQQGQINTNRSRGISSLDQTLRFESIQREIEETNNRLYSSERGFSPLAAVPTAPISATVTPARVSSTPIASPRRDSIATPPTPARVSPPVSRTQTPVPALSVQQQSLTPPATPIAAGESSTPRFVAPRRPTMTNTPASPQTPTQVAPSTPTRVSPPGSRRESIAVPATSPDSRRGSVAALTSQLQSQAVSGAPRPVAPVSTPASLAATSPDRRASFAALQNRIATGLGANGSSAISTPASLAAPVGTPGIRRPSISALAANLQGVLGGHRPASSPAASPAQATAPSAPRVAIPTGASSFAEMQRRLAAGLAGSPSEPARVSPPASRRTSDTDVIAAAPEAPPMDAPEAPPFDAPPEAPPMTAPTARPAAGRPVNLADALRGGMGNLRRVARPSAPAQTPTVSAGGPAPTAGQAAVTPPVPARSGAQGDMMEEMRRRQAARVLRRDAPRPAILNAGRGATTQATVPPAPVRHALNPVRHAPAPTPTAAPTQDFRAVLRHNSPAPGATPPAPARSAAVPAPTPAPTAPAATVEPTAAPQSRPVPPRYMFDT